MVGMLNVESLFSYEIYVLCSTDLDVVSSSLGEDI